MGDNEQHRPELNQPSQNQPSDETTLLENDQASPPKSRPSPKKSSRSRRGTAKELQDTARECGEVLLKFLYSKSSERALRILSTAIKSQFRYGFIMPSKSAIQRSESKKVTEYRKKLRRLLFQIYTKQNIAKSKELDDFLFDHYFLGRPYYYVTNNGSIRLFEVFDRKDEEPEYGAALAYFVITFLRCRYTRKLLDKCHYCKRFYLRERVRRKRRKASSTNLRQKHAFCCPEHKAAFHEDQRVASGKSKEYKRMKRSDPKSPLSYSGFTKRDCTQ